MATESDAKPETTQTSENPPAPPPPVIPDDQEILPDAEEKPPDNRVYVTVNIPDRFKPSDVLQIIVNGALAVIGIFALCIYWGQLNAMKGQLTAMNGQLTAMNGQLTETPRQFPELRASADAATIAANAAQGSAKTAKDTLIASQGAYVTIGRKDGAVAEFITSKDHPDENVPLVVYFQNTGHIPAQVAWDTFDRKDGTLASFGIHLFTTGTGRTPLPPAMLGKNGEFYEALGKVIAGDSVGRNELAYVSQSDFENLSKKIGGFYIDGFYAYCDQLGTWSTHQFTLNYHTDIPDDLRFELISDIEIANTPIPKSIGGKSYFPPCTSTVVMSQTQQYASRKAN